MSSRPGKIEYYFNIAKEVASRSTCLRRKYGAVIVKNDEIISTGYNGAPRGVSNCDSLGKCLRKELNIAPGERYEMCRSVHAEANAIISASRNELIDSVLYLIGFDVDTNEITNFCEPCNMCSRLIINAGIRQVFMLKVENGKKIVTGKDLTSFIEDQDRLGGNLK